MRQSTKLGEAARRALPPTILVGAGLVLFGGFDVLRRGTPPIVIAVICLGLTGVVFLTYLILGVASYRVRVDGTVRVPWPYALAVALAAILVVGALSYFVLRSLPETWR